MPLVENVCGMVKEVFGNNAEVVMGRLVQSMHEGYLQVCNEELFTVYNCFLVHRSTILYI